MPTRPRPPAPPAAQRASLAALAAAQCAVRLPARRLARSVSRRFNPHSAAWPTLLRRALRERRRLALVALLGYLAFGPFAAAPGALPAPLAALALAGLAGAIAVLAPPLRHWTLPLTLSGLVLASLALHLPASPPEIPSASPFDLAGLLGALLAPALWFGLAAVIRALRPVLLALPWPRLRTPCFKARAGSRADLHRLWFGLVPTPGMEAQYGDPDTVAIRDAGGGLGRIHLETRTANGERREVMLRILEIEAPFRVRLGAREATPGGRAVETGVSEIFLVDLGPRRLVLFRHDPPGMTLAGAFLAWLDDSLGRALDQRLASIELRARRVCDPNAVPARGAGYDRRRPHPHPRDRTGDGAPRHGPCPHPPSLGRALRGDAPGHSP